jgi:hypothetical protein
MLSFRSLARLVSMLTIYPQLPFCLRLLFGHDPFPFVSPLGDHTSMPSPLFALVSSTVHAVAITSYQLCLAVLSFPLIHMMCTNIPRTPNWYISRAFQ